MKIMNGIAYTTFQEYTAKDDANAFARYLTAFDALAPEGKEEVRGLAAILVDPTTHDLVRHEAELAIAQQLFPGLLD